MRTVLTLFATSVVSIAALMAAPFGSSLALAHSGVSKCTTADLTLAVGQGQGAAGHQDLQFSFLNKSFKTCKMVGRPHVHLLTANDTPLHTHQQRNPGYMVGHTPRKLLHVAPGKSAYFTIEWEDVPTGNETCPTAMALRVRPPHDRAAIIIGLCAGITPCGGDITVTHVENHPVA